MNWRRFGWIVLIAVIGLGLLTAVGYGGYRLGVTQTRTQFAGAGAMHARMFAEGMPRFGGNWTDGPELGFMGPGRGAFPGRGSAPGYHPMDGPAWWTIGLVGPAVALGLVILAALAGGGLAAAILSGRRGPEVVAAAETSAETRTPKGGRRS